MCCSFDRLPEGRPPIARWPHDDARRCSVKCWAERSSMGLVRPRRPGRPGEQSAGAGLDSDVRFLGKTCRGNPERPGGQVSDPQKREESPDPSPRSMVTAAQNSSWAKPSASTSYCCCLSAMPSSLPGLRVCAPGPLGLGHLRPGRRVLLLRPALAHFATSHT
jgi:hypothetical protein